MSEVVAWEGVALDWGSWSPQRCSSPRRGATSPRPEPLGPSGWQEPSWNTTGDGSLHVLPRRRPTRHRNNLSQQALDCPAPQGRWNLLDSLFRASYPGPRRRVRSRLVMLQPKPPSFLLDNAARGGTLASVPSPAHVTAEQGETYMADKGKRDKGKREQQKRAKLSPKEKRKAKKEKKSK